MRIKSFEYALSLELTDDEVKNNPFMNNEGKASFYRLLCKMFGEYEKLELDCTKINVSKNIQNAWFDYAKENNIEETELSMMLLNCGPKATIEDKNTVTILQGGIK